MNIYLVNGKEIEAETPEEAKRIFQKAYPYIINIFVKDIRNVVMIGIKTINAMST